MPILQGIYTQKGWISQWQQIGVANYDAYALAGRFLELRQMDGYITLPVEPMTDKTHNYSKQRHERSRVNCMEKSERSSGVSFLLFSLKEGSYYVITDINNGQ